jgi:transcriptional regulator with PAS, ATPase and Fis domain
LINTGSVSELVTIDEHRFGPMIGKSHALRQAFEQIAKAAPTHANVIIHGESGTGKELAAQTIHKLSPRRHRHFVPVNCGAIPTELLESEFFGYTKGAFTGANLNKPGYLDWADGGTLFLDEIAELSIIMQVKLLRALDGCGYAPIGSQEVRKPDIRIIAATNRDLKENVRKKLMREDFYYSINVLPIRLPSLKDRKEDLPLLIDHFLSRICQGHKKLIMPPNMRALLEAHRWPGNIRELQNVIQRYATLKEIGFLKAHQTREESTPIPLPEFCFDQDLKAALEEFEKQYIVHCLEAANWHKGNACTILKINRKTLYKKIQRYGLSKIG